MLPALILLPFLAAIVAALLPANARNVEAWLAGGLTLLGLLLTLGLYGQIADGNVLRYELTWLPALGLNFVLRMDGLAWLFVVLVQAIGVLVVVYARYYMSPQDPVPRFFAFLLTFMGAMLGIVLSGNLVQLVVFWELTSVSSFLLICYWHHRADARRGASMAFTVTAAGGLCLLAGVLLVGEVAGSYDLDVVLASGDLLRQHDYYLPALILISLGALTKSAQFPFHFWLPHAMAAPTPVSAYLHSATMVKAGVFLLMRLWPLLSGTPEWNWLIGGAGICTLLLASFVAIFQHDLKGLLAYSTISHLGLITALLGIGTPLAFVAAVFHTLNHAIFKASLFMAAGIIDHECGTRDMRVLRGLRHALPYTATLAIVASASMAGIPLLNGFLSKEMFFAETLLVGDGGVRWVPMAALAMGMFSVAYSLRFISVFFGTLTPDLPQTPHEPPRWMRFPVELLVLACLVVGVLPALSIGGVLDMAAGAVLGSRLPEYHLAIWHGINAPLLMSIAAVLGGILLYVVLRLRFDLRNSKHSPVPQQLNGARLYDQLMLRLSLGADRMLQWFGTSTLQPQLRVILTVLVIVVAVLLAGTVTLRLQAQDAVDPWFVLLWLVGCACALAAAWQAKFHRFAALILVGAAGLATCMTFVWLSAPDLALTQLMVETVTTVLILLGLRWLPPRLSPFDLKLSVPRAVWLRRARDLLIAAGSGLMMAVLSYLALQRDIGNTTLAEFFLLRARSEGGGSNVVNVLLVDFRGFDTLGEITVLAIVALTVYALLRRFRPALESRGRPLPQQNLLDPAVALSSEQQAQRGYLQVPAVYLRFLLPFMGLITFYFFLRGHNLPGGGFVAGLIFAAALIVQYMLGGTVWVEQHLRLPLLKWIGWGLLLSILTGAGALLLGYPFLTSHTAHVYLPVLGEVHLPSAAVFDTGVFLVVVGTTMLILTTLSHQVLRSRRRVAADAERRAV